LNDPGSGEMETIKEQVEQFLAQICKDDSLQEPGLKKMREQIEKYWEKLFTAPIPITRQGKTYTMYPQRTNNVLLSSSSINPQHFVQSACGAFFSRF
jgi:hypothetical protein